MLLLLLERCCGRGAGVIFPLLSTAADYWMKAKPAQGLYFLISRTWRLRSAMRWSIWETSSETYWSPCTRKILVRQAVHTYPHPCQRLTGIVIRRKAQR